MCITGAFGVGLSGFEGGRKLAKKENDTLVLGKFRVDGAIKKAAERRLISLQQKWRSKCHPIYECYCWVGEFVVSLVNIRSSSLASILPSLYSLVN